MSFLIRNVCCIGAGYVGGPTMSVFADKCKHIFFNVVDIDQERIRAWNNPNLSKLPVFEPGLDKIIKRCRGVNLKFSNEVEKGISEADMIFISVNTPTKTKGEGAGKASDLKYVEACARQISKYARGHTIVVEKSTLPVRSGELINRILESKQNIANNDITPTFDILSNPEFLSEGSAINDLEFPDRVLIGGKNNKALIALGEIYSNWVSKEKIIFTNLWSSELAKLTANAFLAQRISSINSIGALCETTGADVREVARAIGTDSRIGEKFLNSGPGFGGSCFKKDILNLVYLANYFGLPEVGKFWEGVVELNNWNQKRLSNIIISKFFGKLKGKKIGILGFAFKANTNDTRESPAIQICKNLLAEEVFLRINDPKVDEKQISLDLKPSANECWNKNQSERLSESKQWKKLPLNNNFFKDLDGLVILTEWADYSTINWEEVSNLMRPKGWVFDSRSITDPQKILKTGLNLWRVGDGTLNENNF